MKSYFDRRWNGGRPFSQRVEQRDLLVVNGKFENLDAKRLTSTNNFRER